MAWPMATIWQKGTPNNMEIITLLLDANQGYSKGPRGLLFHTQMPYNNLRLFQKTICFATLWCQGGYITPPRHLIITPRAPYYNPLFVGLCVRFFVNVPSCSPSLGPYWAIELGTLLGPLLTEDVLFCDVYRCPGKSQKAPQ